MELDSCGIYQWRNIVNGKVYVGKTITSFRKRKTNWKYYLNKKQCNPLLNKSWQKYGEKNFVFEILEIISKNFLNKEQKDQYFREREKFWIDLKDSTNILKGYNIEKDPTIFAYNFELIKQAQIKRNTKKIKICVCGKIIKNYYHTCGSKDCILKKISITHLKRRKIKYCLCGNVCEEYKNPKGIFIRYKSTCNSLVCIELHKKNINKKISQTKKKQFMDKNNNG
jgi:group I intron endonuclease